jgi:putative glycosyltransferase (TIGR04372 family)
MPNNVKPRNPLQRILPRRLIYRAFLMAGALLNLLPRDVVFFLLVACDITKLPQRRRLNAAYLPYATSFLLEKPSFRFARRWSRKYPRSVARVLFGIGAYREAADWIRSSGLAVLSRDMMRIISPALFELGEFDRARTAVAARTSIVDLEKDSDLAFHKAMLEAIAGDTRAAVENMSRACRGNVHLMRPHQNLASRPMRQYTPNYLDHLAGPSGRLFDLCNFAGQRVTHVGRGEIGVDLFEMALDAQSELQELAAPILSAELTRLLDAMDISFDELRIIPEEWTTQIGHLGMLDILFRMRALGWWTGKSVLVVRPNLVANMTFLSLFEDFGKVVVVGETASEATCEELLSLQRWCGMNFNVFRLPNGQVVPWQEAGALAFEQWEREGRGHPLREAYDRIVGPSDFVSDGFRHIREQWGMKPDDWYVCLHIRDAAHYFEFKGTGQTHRNSPIESYLDAIRYITSKGGWVIKLGGPNSPRLPQIDRAVDYALSGFRSDLLDVHLIRHARAFIGTTSGLTNVAVSFGIPSAIVNGITTDSQLWNNTVRFVLKQVRLDNGSMLTQRQLTSSPWRWRVFDAAVLGRSGGHPENNSADEILQAVKEVEALAGGCAAELGAGQDAEALWSRWKSQLALPHYYGTSRPSLYYLKKHEKEFLADSQDPG